MPLQPVGNEDKATQVASAAINQIFNLAKRINKLRAEGVPEIPAQEARTGPNGRELPAREAVSGVTAEEINAALGEENCAILDQIKAAVGVE